MPTSAVQVDPKDVETVLTLEPKVRALVEEIEVALPAVERLRAAKYPGAGHVIDPFRWTLDESDGGSLVQVLETLQELKAGRGDQAVLDFHMFCAKGGKTVAEAATEIFDEIGKTEAALERIDALRRYAATLRDLEAITSELRPENPA